MTTIKITECPRDAMQGIEKFIPTELKLEYQSLLLACGFQILDFGSFVSAKAIPQMADTDELIEKLPTSDTKLLAIVANLKGAERAVSKSRVAILGYPFSISETFQVRNTNRGIDQAWLDLMQIQSLCKEHGKELRVYLSMAFGNPYGDAYNEVILNTWAEKMLKAGITEIAISDTVGLAKPKEVESVFSSLTKSFTATPFIAHLHAQPHMATDKVKAALHGGCLAFDSAIKGFGGCPMAGDTLTGNIATELLLPTIEDEGFKHTINIDPFSEAIKFADYVFNRH